MAAKAQIIKALELGFNHLRRNKLKVSAELTCTILRKPRIHKVIVQLEDFFKNFRVVHDFEDIKGVDPNLDVLASIGKKLTLLNEEAGDYLVEQGMAIPRPPRWGKNNDPEQWWNTVVDTQTQKLLQQVRKFFLAQIGLQIRIPGAKICLKLP
jgi:hypothetical protein